MKKSYLIELSAPNFSKFLGYTTIVLGEDTSPIKRVVFGETLNGAEFFQYKSEALHVYNELLKEVGAVNTGKRTLLPPVVASFIEGQEPGEVFGVTVSLHTLEWKEGHFTTVAHDVAHQHTFVVKRGKEGEPYHIDEVSQVESSPINETRKVHNHYSHDPDFSNKVNKALVEPFLELVMVLDSVPVEEPCFAISLNNNRELFIARRGDEEMTITFCADTRSPDPMLRTSWTVQFMSIHGTTRVSGIGSVKPAVDMIDEFRATINEAKEALLPRSKQQG